MEKKIRRFAAKMVKKLEKSLKYYQNGLKKSPLRE